jgi:ribose 5-phosphate isomerase B
MKIYIGTDHAGFKLKEVLKKYLLDLEYEVVDFGTNSEESCDYPDFIFPVAEAVSEDSDSRGIILGGSGQGEAMTANRVKGVRATVYYGYDKSIIELSRSHNNANVLSLGARFVDEEEAKEVVKEWLQLKFPEEERHVKRIKKMDER